MKDRTWIWPVIGAIFCLAAGGASGVASAGGAGSDWYHDLVKTPGTPPPWVFGPVWSLLYLLMGTAAGLLVVRKAWSVLGWFGVQFLLNLAWSPVFFGSRQPGVALGIIVAMLVLIIATLLKAKPVSRTATWLLVPYAVWVGYATWLNAGIVVLNH